MHHRAISVHYVDTQWNLQTHCLQAHYLPEDHTGVQLQDALSVTLEQWELNEKKCTPITTDSASNIKLACQLLKWKRLSFFGHNLDLAINKGLNNSRIERTLSMCQKVVAAFSSSWKRQRDLKDTQNLKAMCALDGAQRLTWWRGFVLSWGKTGRHLT